MDGPEDAASFAILEASRFWVQKVMIPITVGIGVAGNTITVMVLTRRRMRSSTNIYLSALAIADIIHLFFVFLLSFKHYSNIHDGKYGLYWRFFGLTHWFCDAASSTSVWLTVSFTVERYIAVCHPIKGKVFCTERRAKSIIVIVYIFCILTTASTTFEYQLNLNETCIEECKLDVTKQQQTANATQEKKINTNLIANQVHDSEATSMTISKIGDMSQENVLEKPPSEMETLNNTIDFDSNQTGIELDNTTCCVKKYNIDVESTRLGKNDTYTTLMYWYSAIFFWLLPLALIATFNCFLVRAVYLSQKMRRAMTNSQESISISNEKKITLMLIAVVVMFIICHTPTASILIYNNFHKSKTRREKNIKLILGNFFNFLSIVNASCNFLLYCFLSRKFRSTFKKLFFDRRKKRQDTIMLSSTKSKNSQKFNPYKHGLMRRNASEYHTPRNLETQSLTSIPRSKSLMVRPIGKAKSSDLSV